MNKQSIQKTIRGIGYALWVLVVCIAASYAVGIPIGYLGSDSVLRWFMTPVGQLALLALVDTVAVCLALLPMIVNKVSWRELSRRVGLANPFQFKMLTWALFAWGLYFIASFVVMIVVASLQLPGVDLQQQQDVGFSNIAVGYEYVAAFVALVIAAPFFEELLFRGYLFGRIRQNSGFWYSAILTSLVFALLHGQINVGIDVFVLSMFLCYLRDKFDSIWPGVIVHALKNGLAYTILFILPLYGIKLV